MVALQDLQAGARNAMDNGVHHIAWRRVGRESDMKTFADKVRDVVRKIPKGKTMTYKQVAAKAGNPKAARAVGAVMRSNYLKDVPCHRVVRSDDA